MKNFLAIYLGTEAAVERSGWTKLSDEQRRAREQEGMAAWMNWAKANAASIVDHGAPLGKTKRASAEGLGDVKNAMAGYVIVRAESHDAAAKLFANHPHFTVFPGESVEIMECLPMPGA
jgi:hypothetical protein